MVCIVRLVGSSCLRGERGCRGAGSGRAADAGEAWVRACTRCAAASRPARWLAPRLPMPTLPLSLPPPLCRSVPLNPKEAAKRSEALRRKALQRAHSRAAMGEAHSSGLGKLLEAAKHKLHLPLGGDLERMASGDLTGRTPSAAEAAGAHMADACAAGVRGRAAAGCWCADWGRVEAVAVPAAIPGTPAPPS